jgi:biopolymer transport protein ExbB/TolQ
MNTASPGWMVLAHWLERGVLLTLLSLSVWSVAIMIDRFRYFRSLKGAADLEAARRAIETKDRDSLKNWAGKTQHPTAGVLQAAMAVNGTEAVDRAVRSYMTEKRTEMDRGLTVLATLGSNAPFIGLFGTVLGVIKAFGGLAESSAEGTQAVMASISFALVATAVGLFVAIPAVVAYNVFAKQLKAVQGQCEWLRDLYLSRF